MNYGIGNVKGKSGGGGIPVITLQASQMVDSTHIQFTEEQYNTIANNGAFYLDILGTQQLLMTCVNASNLADIQCYNISQTGSGLQLATIDLNKSTYIGVLGVSPYSQAKQLYQHNIQMYANSPSFRFYFTIISERSTSYTTMKQIIDFLIDKLGTHSKWIGASGCYNYNSNSSGVMAVSVSSDYQTYDRLSIRFYYTVASQSAINYSSIDIDASYTSISDNVIAL